MLRRFLVKSIIQTTNNPFVVAAVQLAMTEDIDKNMQNAAAWVKRAAKQGANVVCLPEMYRSRYFCQREDITKFDLAEPVPGPSSALFSELAKELKVAIIVPIFELRAPGLHHNSAVVIDSDGAILGLYRKMHIPDDPGYYEKYFFAPGDLGFKAFATAKGNIGVLICWDQWYPEAARLTALRGASALFYPTAIGWHPSEREEFGAAQREAWMTVQRGHAVANATYVIAANRVGLERPDSDHPGIIFWGSSFIADPQGAILAKAPEDQEAAIFAEVDPTHIETVRRNWPFLRDRRIDAYGDITRRFIDNGLTAGE
jgi:N-carbamoylputrescine amidase